MKGRQSSFEAGKICEFDGVLERRIKLEEILQWAKNDGSKFDNVCEEVGFFCGLRNVREREKESTKNHLFCEALFLLREVLR